jgi:hypothetical protein
MDGPSRSPLRARSTGYFAQRSAYAGCVSSGYSSCRTARRVTRAKARNKRLQSERKVSEGGLRCAHQPCRAHSSHGPTVAAAIAATPTATKNRTREDRAALEKMRSAIPIRRPRAYITRTRAISGPNARAKPTCSSGLSAPTKINVAGVSNTVPKSVKNNVPRRFATTPEMRHVTNAPKIKRRTK